MNISRKLLTFDENFCFKIRYKYYNYDKIENQSNKEMFIKIPIILNDHLEREEMVNSWRQT